MFELEWDQISLRLERNLITSVLSNPKTISTVYIPYQSTFATPQCQLILEKICDSCNNFSSHLYNPSHWPLIPFGEKKISNQKTYQLNNHHNYHRASITLHHLLSQSINVTTPSNSPLTSHKIQATIRFD